MSIKMPNRKYPQITVQQRTYLELQELKFAMKARSLDAVIKDLVNEHQTKQEA